MINKIFKMRPIVVVVMFFVAVTRFLLCVCINNFIVQTPTFVKKKKEVATVMPTV